MSKTVTAGIADGKAASPQTQSLPIKSCGIFQATGFVAIPVLETQVDTQAPLVTNNTQFHLSLAGPFSEENAPGKEPMSIAGIGNPVSGA
jgi:hypothetical protein